MKKFTMFIMATCFAMYGMATINLQYSQDFSALTSGNLASMLGQTATVDADNLLGIATVTNSFQAGGVIEIGSSASSGGLITEEINTANYDSISVTFKSVAYGWYFSQPSVLIVSYNGVDSTVTVPYTHAFPLNVNEFTEFTVKFEVAAAPTAVSIVSSTSATFISDYRSLLDDLSISGLYSVAPSCAAPTNLSATATGASSANIAWTGGSESAWNVVISTATVSDFSAETPIVVSTNSYSAAGLNPNTLYHVYVQADCGSETSDWTAVATFTTQCAAVIALPWTENFDSYIVGTTPDCWTQVLSNAGYPSVFTGQQVSTPNSLRFDIAQTEIIATPAFSMDLSTLIVSFYVMKNPMQGDFASGAFEVGVMSNVSDPSTFELIQDATPTAARTYTQFTVSLANAPTGSHYIAFRLNDPIGSWPGYEYFAMDNVEVTLNTGELVPPTVNTLPTNTYTSTTATLRKTVVQGSETITAEGFEYQVTGDISWITVTDGDLIGLTPSTNYSHRAFATTASDTYRGFTINFTTLSDGSSTPPTVTTLAANPIGQTTATLNKTVIAGSEPILSEGFEYQVVGSMNWIATDGNLIGLTPATNYAFRALATTATGPTYGGIMTFVTLSEGTVTPPTVTTLEANPVGQTTATLHKTVVSGSEVISAEGFEYQVTGSGSWTAAPSNGNLVGLTSNTSYDFYAFATTATGTYYGDTLNFTTQDESTVTPPTVETVAATDVLSTTATLNKNVTPGTEAITAQGWKYRKVSDTDWIDVTNGELTGLTPATTYEFYAYATAGGITIDGATLTFITQNDGAGYDTANTNEFIIYPNPTNSTATVKVEGLNTSAKVTVTDINGKLIEARTISAGNDTTELDVASYTDGTYLVRVVADGINRVEKLIVKK